MFSHFENIINMSENRYSIKDLENFTQIKAHTIRIWEQRYNMFEPKRTDTNIRYYNDSDLKKILNINLLYNHGYKISKIAALPEPEIINVAKEIIMKGESDFQSDIDHLILSILEFDKTSIISRLETRAEELSIEGLYDKIIIPTLLKIGELWQVNSFEIIHEHFFSNLLRDFLINKIHSLENSTDVLRSAVLFLHEEEEHELSLLMYHYLLKRKGYKCHYFGQNVPIAEVDFAVEKINPQMVVSVFVATVKEKVFGSIMTHLAEINKSSQVVISGSQLDSYPELIPKGIQVVKTFDQITKLISD